MYKKEGYSKSKIGLITPEIRTVDEYAHTNITFLDDDEESNLPEELD